jgi:hypothetical protein
LRPRLTTGLPLSQRTRMCPQEPIITRADEFPMNFEGLGVSFRHFFISRNILRAGARTSENSVKAKFAEFLFHALG